MFTFPLTVITRIEIIMKALEGFSIYLGIFQVFFTFFSMIKSTWMLMFSDSLIKQNLQNTTPSLTLKRMLYVYYLI